LGLSLSNRTRLVLVLLAGSAPLAYGASGTDVYGPPQALQDFQQGRYPNIDKNFETVLAQGDPDPKYLLYLDAKAMGRPENLASLRAWLAANPRSWAGWASMGFLYKSYADAFKAHNVALNDPNYVSTLNSYKTCLDRACQVEPQAALLWGLEIQALLYFSPNDSLMEDYFQRGLRLDRNDFLIYAAKAEYQARQAKPDWQAVKNFLVDAGKRVKPSCRTTLLGVYYHELYADYNGEIGADYLAQPDNWDEIVSGLGDFLWNHPDDIQVRSWYARLSSEAQKYTEAAKQFKQLNDDAWMYGGWGSKDSFLKARKYAQDHQ
jgi:hypothetical protein